MSSSGCRKRTAIQPESSSNEATRKITKIHPFFQKTADGGGATIGRFQWLDPLGPTRSCLHGVNNHPKSLTRVAAFDLDGTLIKSQFEAGSASSASPSWDWWRSIVPGKLQELVDSGYAVIIISNQALKPVALKVWKLKIALIAAAIPNIPFRLFAATAKDGYRKPMPGIWTELERIFREDGVEIDRADSFFVGDAAGRQYAGNKSDFSSTDRKWALNVEIPFFTPEEYFLQLSTHFNYTLSGFHVSSLPVDLPPFTPTLSPLLPSPPKQELVVFVGYPCLGKTSLYRCYFQSAGYTHINQDILKTRDKCLREMQKALQDGKSCVIDNTNSNKATRKYYIDIARQLDIPRRCLIFSGSIELAWHNNLYRAYINASSVTDEPRRELIPYVGFIKFRDNFEQPQQEEGFTEVKTVNWIFNGTDDEKKYWSMWLQIDGK